MSAGRRERRSHVWTCLVLPLPPRPAAPAVLGTPRGGVCLLQGPLSGPPVSRRRSSRTLASPVAQRQEVAKAPRSLAWEKLHKEQRGLRLPSFPLTRGVAWSGPAH